MGNYDIRFRDVEDTDKGLITAQGVTVGHFNYRENDDLIDITTYFDSPIEGFTKEDFMPYIEARVHLAKIGWERFAIRGIPS